MDSKSGISGDSLISSIQGLFYFQEGEGSYESAKEPSAAADTRLYFFHEKGRKKWTYELLRFYNDGLVLSVSVLLHTTLKDSWPSIRKWFCRNSETRHSIGNYRLSGGKISFTTTSENGVVEFDGTFDGQELTLNINSRINGFRKTSVKFNRADVDDQESIATS